MQWQPIATVPFDRDLELAVIDADESHALVFPCRRTTDGRLLKVNEPELATFNGVLGSPFLGCP